MDKSIRLFNYRLPLALHPGTITHVDKYTEVEGGVANIPVVATIHTALVFRSADSFEDVHLTAPSMNVPVRPGQHVNLLRSGTLALGFVDEQQGRVWYIVRNIARQLGIGISPLLTLAIALACAALPMLIYGWRAFEAALLPFAITWALYFAQNRILNLLIKRKIKNLLHG